MGLLTRAYNSDNSPHVATVVLSIGSALLFSVGVFLIVHAQFSNQAKTLKRAQATINELANKTDGEFDTITVNEESNLNGDLNVGGSTTLSGDLSVNGEGQVTTVLGVDGDTNFDQTLDVKGGVLLKGDLSVLGATTLQSSVAVGGDASLGEGLNIGGALNTKGDFSSSGATTIRGSVSVGGDTSFDLSTGGTFSLQGGFSTGGDLSIAGSTVLQQGLSVTGAESTSTFDGTGSSNSGTILLGNGGPTFTVQGSTGLTGDLSVLGVALLGGPLTVSALNNTSPDFSPTTTFDGTGSSAGSTILLGSGPTLQVQGGTSLVGDLNVMGTTSIAGNLTVTALNNTSTDYIPTAIFDATGTNAGNTVLLGSGTSFVVQNSATLQGDIMVNGTVSMGSLTQTAINTSSPDYNPSLTFDATGTNGVSTILLGSNPSFNVSGNASLQGDLTVNGTTSIGGALTVNSINNSDPAFSPSHSLGGDLTVSLATTLYGDMSVSGNSFLNNALTIQGAADFAGNITVACVSDCLNNQMQIGGRVTADLIYGADHISSAEFGISDGSTYTAGKSISETGTCGGSEHIHIYDIVGGLVISAACVADASGGDLKYDLAEKFTSDDVLAAGDVVTIDLNKPEQVKKTSSSNDNNAIGVVSTDPGITLGNDGPGYPIALSGRVPVNISSEGGNIIAGDYLTSASLPGFAKKALPGEKIIGQALEGFSGTTGQIKMFVNVSPGQASNPNDIQANSLDVSSLNVSGQALISNLEVTGIARIETLEVSGLAKLADIRLSGHFTGNQDTRGTLTIPAGSQTGHVDFARQYSEDPIVIATPVEQATLFSVKATKTGFDINITTPLSSDIKFNYMVQE